MGSVHTERGSELIVVATDIDLNEYLEEALSSFRHQLGNTINSMRLVLGILNENFSLYDDSQKLNYLSQITEIVGQQQSIIEALKAYSIYSAKHQTNIYFDNLWNFFIEAAQDKVNKKGIQLNQYTSVLGCQIRGNAMALNKIFTCVLDNALEAVDGHDAPYIEIFAKKQTNSIIIGMKDNGSGISQERISKIFVPLFSTKAGKAGMGLAICRKLLSEMSGDIHVTSQVGQGTEVNIKLRTLYN